MPWLSLSLKSFPFLTSAATGTYLEWNHGPMYNILLTSTYVRVNELGIQWSSLCSLPAPRLYGPGWSPAVQCVPVQDAFCITQTSPAVPLFPTNIVELMPGGALPAELQSSVTCNPQTANRALVLGDGGYQVSLCDLIDRKLDVVLDVNNSQIFWVLRNEQMWWSVLVTLSSLYFFTRVCEHLVLLVQGKRRRFSLVNTVATGIMLVLHRMIPLPNVFSQHLVTTEEQILDWILYSYSWLHILVQLVTVCFFKEVQYPYIILRSSDTEKEVEGPESTSHDISTLGLLVCVQLILTAHLQGSYDNPFLSILVILFGTRSFLKFLNLNLEYSVEERSSAQSFVVCSKLIFLFIDTFTLASMLELGIRIGARSGLEYASTASGLLLIIVLGGTFLHEVIHRKR